ncbi:MULTISPECIES: hypothetical protein [Alphaproteobacteria]|uniref:hypothetical protein n=1 Tax=Alphaproteobacteria TaxID=28211 RepID=UPI003A8F65DA
MTHKAKKLEQLKKVAEVTLTLELGKLAQVRAQETEQENRLDELKTSAKDREVQIQNADAFDPAMSSGADAKWNAWMMQERRRILTNMAVIAERREVQFEHTRRAFGKVEALKSIAKKSALKP